MCLAVQHLDIQTVLKNEKTENERGNKDFLYEMDTKYNSNWKLIVEWRIFLCAILILMKAV